MKRDQLSTFYFRKCTNLRNPGVTIFLPDLPIIIVNVFTENKPPQIQLFMSNIRNKNRKLK